MTRNHQPPPPHRSFWDTPPGAAQLNSTHARLLDSLRAPNSRFGDRIHAWADYRQERFTETGLEGMTGTDAIYHWHADFAGPLTGAAKALSDDYLYPTARAKFHAATSVLAYVHGFRWKRGIDGLMACIQERGNVEQFIVFTAETQAFEARIVALANAAETLACERQWSAALGTVRAALQAALDEAERAVRWLEQVGEHSTACLLLTGAESLRAALHTSRIQPPAKRRRRSSRNDWAI